VCLYKISTATATKRPDQEPENKDVKARHGEKKRREKFHLGISGEFIGANQFYSARQRALTGELALRRQNRAGREPVHEGNLNLRPPDIKNRDGIKWRVPKRKKRPQTKRGRQSKGETITLKSTAEGGSRLGEELMSL